MTFRRRNKCTDHLCTDIYAPGLLGAERVNCSKFLFLLFHLILKNIANWNKCKRIYCKECKMESNGGNSVKHCFRAVEPRVLSSTRKILPSIHKDAVSSIQQSMVVYEYVCRCDCRYVSRTSLRSEEIINQHVPNFIPKQQPTKILPKRKCKIRFIATHQQCVSAIGLHFDAKS